MKLSTLLGSMALVVTSQSLAQPVPSEKDLRRVTDQIMDRVGKGEVEAGLELLKGRTIIPAAEFDAMVGQTKLQLPAMTQRFGGSLGYEFLKAESLGENLSRFTYIHRFDRHAMRWLFYNYRGKDGWVVNSFRFDDNLPALFPQ